MNSMIFDPIRKKRVALTPEEGVRQQLINMLDKKLGYPASLMVCEYSIIINGLRYRGDLVVLDKALKPLFLAECKAPSVNITRDTFEQILRYNMALNVRHILLTNGRTSYFASLDATTKNFKYLTEIPPYNELSE